jgi:hypothetical protein
MPTDLPAAPPHSAAIYGQHQPDVAKSHTINKPRHEKKPTPPKQALEPEEEPPCFIADRRYPDNPPKARLWSLEVCREVMTIWVYTKEEEQTPEVMDVVENLLFDKTTGEFDTTAGAWLSDANRRYHVTSKVRVWLWKAFRHYGYYVYATNDLEGRKLIYTDYAPTTTPQDLPSWFPLIDIGNLGPQPVFEGFHDRQAWIDSQLE